MPSERILNGLLNRIGNFSPSQFQSDFDKRLILQKTIYLMQAFGLNIGFSYNWYLRGPYSSELAKTAYIVAKNYDAEISSKFHDEPSEKRFCQFLSFLGTKKDNHVWLETVASIHFLAKLYGEQNEKMIYEKVNKKMGDHLSREVFNDAWTNLCSNGLLSRRIM